MNKIRDTLIKYIGKKNTDIILYLVFGFFTTLVNILTFWFCRRILTISIVISTLIAWIISVEFAYVTNKTWVFTSKVSDIKGVLYEFISFVSCRALTGAMDIVIMEIFANRLKINDMVVKIVSNVLVVILNYVASKLVIFKKNNNENRVDKNEDIK